MPALFSVGFVLLSLLGNLASAQSAPPGGKDAQEPPNEVNGESHQRVVFQLKDVTLTDPKDANAYRTALRYEFGLGVRRDSAEASRWMRIAAEAGNPDAAYQVGLKTTDQLESITWFQKAAEKNHIPALLALVKHYVSEPAMPRNDAEALKWARRGAELGDRECMAWTGLLSSDYGKRGDPVDYDEAALWLEKSAELSEKDYVRFPSIVQQAAMYQLGWLVENGYGEPRDLGLAAQWYLKSAEAGFRPAMSAIASVYEQGIGVEPNPEAARTWYGAAAAKGDAAAGKWMLDHPTSVGRINTGSKTLDDLIRRTGDDRPLLATGPDPVSDYLDRFALTTTKFRPRPSQELTVTDPPKKTELHLDNPVIIGTQSRNVAIPPVPDAGAGVSSLPASDTTGPLQIRSGADTDPGGRANDASSAKSDPKSQSNFAYSKLDAVSISLEEKTAGLNFNLDNADVRLAQIVVVQQSDDHISGPTDGIFVPKVGLLWGNACVSSGSSAGFTMSWWHDSESGKAGQKIVEIGELHWSQKGLCYEAGGDAYISFDQNTIRKTPATFEIFVERSHPFQGAFVILKIKHDVWKIFKSGIEVPNSRKQAEDVFNRTFTTAEYSGAWERAYGQWETRANSIRLCCRELEEITPRLSPSDAKEIAGYVARLRDAINHDAEMYLEEKKILLQGGTFGAGKYKGRHYDKPERMSAPPADLADSIGDLYTTAFEEMPTTVKKVRDSVERYRAKLPSASIK